MKKEFEESLTLSRAITNLCKTCSTDINIVYKSKRYGLIWAGKLRFFRNALTFEALQKMDFEIVHFKNEIKIIVA